MELFLVCFKFYGTDSLKQKLVPRQDRSSVPVWTAGFGFTHMLMCIGVLLVLF